MRRAFFLNSAVCAWMKAARSLSAVVTSKVKLSSVARVNSSSRRLGALPPSGGRSMYPSAPTASMLLGSSNVENVENVEKLLTDAVGDNGDNFGVEPPARASVACASLISEPMATGT